MKERVLKKVLLFISDALKDIFDRIAVSPDANCQMCCVHLARSVAHKVRVADRKETCDDFKSVYRAESRELGEEEQKVSIDK